MKSVSQRQDALNTLERPVSATNCNTKSEMLIWRVHPSNLVLATLMDHWVLQVMVFITKALTALSAGHQRHRTGRNIYVGQNTKDDFFR